MKVWIAITYSHTTGTDFPPIVDAVPFRTKSEADAFLESWSAKLPKAYHATRWGTLTVKEMK